MCRRAKTGLGARTGTDAGLPRGKNGRGELVRELICYSLRSRGILTHKP